MDQWSPWSAPEITSTVDPRFSTALLEESRPLTPHTTRPLRGRVYSGRRIGPAAVAARSQPEHARRLRPLRLSRSRQIGVDGMLLGEVDGYGSWVLDEQLQRSQKGVPRRAGKVRWFRSKGAECSQHVPSCRRLRSRWAMHQTLVHEFFGHALVVHSGGRPRGLDQLRHALLRICGRREGQIVLCDVATSSHAEQNPHILMHPLF